jgi:hypothetical protein
VPPTPPHNIWAKKGDRKESGKVGGGVQYSTFIAEGKKGRQKRERKESGGRLEKDCEEYHIRWKENNKRVEEEGKRTLGDGMTGGSEEGVKIMIGWRDEKVKRLKDGAKLRGNEETERGSEENGVRMQMGNEEKYRRVRDYLGMGSGRGVKRITGGWEEGVKNMIGGWEEGVKRMIGGWEDKVK